MSIIKKKKTPAAITASARVVDGTLVLSLPDAISPIVWRWNLNDTKASALEVNEQEEGFQLIWKDEKGNQKEIALYKEKEKAISALLEASSAMENSFSSSHIAAQRQDNATQPTQSFVRNPNAQEDGNLATTITIGVGGLIIIGVLLLWLGSIQPRDISSTLESQNNTEAANLDKINASPQETTGEPVSADDFLSSF